jgi:hypothetical protein
MIWIGSRTKSAADTDKKARELHLSIVKRDSVQSRLRDKVTKKSVCLDGHGKRNEGKWVLFA